MRFAARNRQVVDGFIGALPEGEPLFGKEVLTDQAERVLAAEYVREQHLYWLRTRTRAVNPTAMRQFRIRMSDPLGFKDNWSLLSGPTVFWCPDSRQRRRVCS